MTDPHSRQPAYDAVFAYIRQHPAHAATDYGQAAENARLWRAVEAALDAMEAMTDLIPDPRPVPTQEDRMRDARTDHTFATYLDRTERDQLDARAACAEQERDEARDDLQIERTKTEMLTANMDRYRQERDEALDARNVLRQQLDTARAELGAALELLAVVDDLAEQLDRARARYATRPDATPVEPEKRQLQHVSVLGNCIACGARCPNGRCPNDTPAAPASVPPRRAQEDGLTDRLAGALAEVMRSHTGADVSVASWGRWEALLVEHAEREG